MSVEINRDKWVEETTEVAVEKVDKFRDDDSAFFTELRVLTGPQMGQLKKNLWFRTKQSGDPRKDTNTLFVELTNNPTAPSYELVDKKFTFKPWYPPGSDYAFFGEIKKTGEVDPFAEEPAQGPANPLPDDGIPF